MELKRIKGKLVTARRGHKLLKDKCDELMRQFLDTVREAKLLREKLTERLSDVSDEFRLAAADVDPRMLTEALMLPSADCMVSVSERNVMSVLVPEFSEPIISSAGGAGYGYAFTTDHMDHAADSICNSAQELVRLAQLEKACQLMSHEIERTRRRVNALEYIMIPQYEETIRRISMKLDENERSNLTRLMKVKDMMLEAKLSQHTDD